VTAVASPGVELKGQARRGADRRRAILVAATHVFARRGYRAGGLAEVAEAAGVTPANILYHFGSKEALLLAVIEYRDERANALGADLWPNSEARALDSLRGLVRFAEMAEAEPGLAKLHTMLQIENLEPGDLAYEYFQARTKRSQRWVAALLKAAQASGELRSDVDPTAKAREIVAFLEGAAVLWLLNPHLSIKTLYVNYLNGVVEELTAPPSRNRPTPRRPARR
jgi:AcrR family transcriptional regulator